MTAPYRMFIASAADRRFKRMPRRMRETIEAELAALLTNPYAGERLSGPLDFLYSYHFTVFGQPLRAAYTVNATDKAVTLHYIGPRGEFYQRLRHLFGK